MKFGIVNIARQTAGRVGRFVVQHDRVLLAGAAIAGVVVTVGVTARAAIKTKEILDNTPDDADKIEVAKKVAPVVLPAMSAAAATIVAIVLGHKKGSQKITALAGAYTMSREALKDFQAKTKEYVGEEGYKEIESGSFKKKLERQFGLEKPEDAGDHEKVRHAVETCEDIIDTGSGNDFFVDDLTLQKFKASRQFVENAANHLQHRINSGYYGYDNIPYTEFLSQVGVRSPKLAYLIGWQPQSMIELRLDESIVMGDHPYFVVRFANTPDVIIDSLN